MFLEAFKFFCMLLECRRHYFCAHERFTLVRLFLEYLKAIEKPPLHLKWFFDIISNTLLPLTLLTKLEEEEEENILFMIFF